MRLDRARSERGTDAVEYVLLIAALALVIVFVVVGFTKTLDAIFTHEVDKTKVRTYP